MAGAVHEKFRRPPWVALHLLNPMMKLLVGRLGLEIGGRRVLRIRGRASGEWRATPVNLLVLDGVLYVVSPRGESNWVKNLRAAGEALLVHGRSTRQVRAVELPADAAAPILRGYVTRWESEARGLFSVGPGGSDSEFRGIAPMHPVFRLE